MKHRKRIISALMLGTILMPLQTHAIFGSGVVFDPTNFAQNLLTATQAVRQVNNQVRQIENEVRIIANQADDLQSLSYSSLQDIEARLRQIDDLIKNANSIAYSVAEMEYAFRIQFPGDYSTLSNSQSIATARAQWTVTRDAYHDALLVQAEIAGLVSQDQSVLTRLVTESQQADGNLQALQAGNQLSALQTKQLMQNQLLVASQYRAEALERVEAKEARQRSGARFTNFVGSGTAYTP